MFPAFNGRYIPIISISQESNQHVPYKLTGRSPSHVKRISAQNPVSTHWTPEMGLEEKPRSSVYSSPRRCTIHWSGNDPRDECSIQRYQTNILLRVFSSFSPLSPTPNALTFSCYVRVVFEDYPTDHWTLKGLAILRTRTHILYRFVHPSIGGSKILQGEFFKVGPDQSL